MIIAVINIIIMVANKTLMQFLLSTGTFIGVDKTHNKDTKDAINKYD